MSDGISRSASHVCITPLSDEVSDGGVQRHKSFRLDMPAMAPFTESEHLAAPTQLVVAQSSINRGFQAEMEPKITEHRTYSKKYEAQHQHELSMFDIMHTDLTNDHTFIQPVYEGLDTSFQGPEEGAISLDELARITPFQSIDNLSVIISDGFPVDSNSKPHFLDMLCLTSSEPCEPNRLNAGDETKQRKRGREDQPLSCLMDQALPEFAELHKPFNLEHVSDIDSGMEALDSPRSSKQMCSGSSSTLAQQIMLQIKKPTKLGGNSMSSNTVVGNSMSSLSENVLNSTRISRKMSRSNSTSVTLDMGTEIESNINCTSGKLNKSASFSVMLRPSSACSSLESPILGRVLELIDPAHAGRVAARTSTIIRSTVVSQDSPRGDERDGASYCLGPHVSGRDASQGLPPVHGNMTEVVAIIGGGYVSSCKSPAKEYEGNENSGHQSGSTSSLSDGFRETEEGLLQPDPIHPHNLGASALNHSTSANGVSSPALKQKTSFAAWEFHDDAIHSAYYSWQHDSFLDSARIALDLLNAPLDFPQFGNMTRISGAFVFPAATQQQQSHGVRGGFGSIAMRVAAEAMALRRRSDMSSEIEQKLHC